MSEVLKDEKKFNVNEDGSYSYSAVVEMVGITKEEYEQQKNVFIEDKKKLEELIKTNIDDKVKEKEEIWEKDKAQVIVALENYDAFTEKVVSEFKEKIIKQEEQYKEYLEKFNELKEKDLVRTRQQIEGMIKAWQSQLNYTNKMLEIYGDGGKVDGNNTENQ